MLRKSQTATEYLILLAVVIVIALIVISVLGGIPSIGGGASSSASEARLKSLGIGVENYAFSNESGVITVKNNKADSVSVTAVYVDSKECGYGSFTLRAGQSRKINCSNITNSGSSYEYDVSMNWTDVESGAKYVQSDSGLKIAGTVVEGLNTNVGSSGSSGGSGGGSPPVYVPTYLLTFSSPNISDGGTSPQAGRFYTNVSVPTAALESLDFDWNGVNYTVYNDSLILMYNFDNVSALGEDQSTIVDVSTTGASATLVGSAPVASLNPDIALSAYGTTCSASATLSGSYPCTGAIDGNPTDGTYWHAGNNPAIPGWMQLNFPQNETITGFYFDKTNEGSSYIIKDWIMQYWNTTHWVNISETEMLDDTNRYWSHTLSSSVYTDKIRVFITEKGPDSYGMKLFQFTVYGEIPMKHGGAMYFDGSNDYLSIPDSEDFNFGAGDFAFSYWVNFASLSGDITMIDQYYDQRAFELKYFDGDLYFKWSVDGSSVVQGSNAWTPSTDTWYHIVMLRDGSSVKQYVNGAQLGSDINIGAATIYNSNEPVWIGCAHTGAGGDTPGEFFPGMMDELRVYKRTVSAAEVKFLYDSNLRKYDTDKWNLFVNQSVNSGTYEYQAFVNVTSSLNSSERRSVTVS